LPLNVRLCSFCVDMISFWLSNERMGDSFLKGK
jgi:hypothetical protein